LERELLRAELRACKSPAGTHRRKSLEERMAATYVKVNTEDQQKHRSLGAILESAEVAARTPSARTRRRVFTKLGKARANFSNAQRVKADAGAHDATMASTRPLVKMNFPSGTS